MKRPKKAKQGKGGGQRKLSPKQLAFCREYVVDLIATQAAIRAGYSAATAYSQGQRLLKDVEVQAEIARLMDERSKRTEITADRVLQELWGIATADVNELVEHRCCCCRYCHGIEHKYQLTTGEERRAIASHLQAEQEARQAGTAVPPPFDPAGGTGFNATLPPHPECPECFGEGEMRPVFKDSRKVSPGALSLYAGVKLTKDGIEVKIHSKDKALELLGRHLKLFSDKLELTGANGAPLQSTALTPEQLAQVERVRGRREALKGGRGE